MFTYTHTPVGVCGCGYVVWISRGCTSLGVIVVPSTYPQPLCALKAILILHDHLIQSPSFSLPMTDKNLMLKSLDMTRLGKRNMPVVREMCRGKHGLV